MKTHVVRGKDVERRWLLVDAEGQTLGRLASHVVGLLRGKGKPTYTPSMDQGDHVVITNAAKVQISGDKVEYKKYYRHSGYPGGLHVRSMRVLMETKPDEVVYRAIWRMMPSTPQGRAQMRRLRIYPGAAHRQQAQTPRPENATA